MRISDWSSDVCSSDLVRRDENGASVFVTEGVVEIWVDGDRAQRRRLSAGMQAYVSERATAYSMREAPAEIERKLSWRTGDLTLDGESLEYAVGEINRYNARKVVIARDALRREHLAGFFRTGGGRCREGVLRRVSFRGVP